MEKTNQDPVKIKFLLLGSLIYNIGISFIWPLTTIYMHQYLHQTLTVAAIVLLLYYGTTLLGNAIGGAIFDKITPFKTILLGAIITSLCALAMVLIPAWPFYPIFLVIYGIGDGIVTTAINSIATTMKTHASSFFFNLLYMTRNLGLVIGSLLVGIITFLGPKAWFASAFTFFVVFAILLLIFFRKLDHANLVQAAPTPTHQNISTKKNFWIIISLVACMFFCWLAYEQWDSNLSVHMLNHGISTAEYSFCWTLNSALITISQPILTYFDGYLSKKINARLYIGFVLFASSFLILIGANNYWNYLLAMFILTCGEALAFPAVSAYVHAHAPKSQAGRYQGLVLAGTSAGRALAALFGAILLNYVTMPILLLILASLIIIALINFILFNSLRKKDA
ncbi:MFS transporter [Lactobacillus mulieris]|uniref:MFS transporter n=1 Tax=Lactobacillus mulieris TaxID=2508708 RepID=A0AAW5WZ22_9LACO|nr:MFS transporter [Lactobacillus mulieris]MCZ3622407.1 MFS transporter [Lactobacillus mulieris]MCZ3624040.1 MFS transporter [Lactobacillus mulieris]MCZ3636410.1 MFS transporter [Lactobacillus mulieris]MCZ3690465.1 MFS transporter [Lactobacillus mulieris]MCZ3695952.1 MFS transporter [Lactobacillus mulieris]